MSRVLITGGNGFLGSNLVRYFLKEKWAVMVVSRKFTNLTDVLNRITFDDQLSPDRIKAFSPTIVIHCAWDGGNSYNNVNGFQQPRNIEYGVNLLEILADITPRPAFIGVGSFAEYGVMSTPVKETDTCSPITLYGLSKLSFKNISEMICQKNGISWKWIRPCYIYGEYDVHTRLIPSVIQKCVSGNPVLLDSCLTILDYLHVDDFCTAVSAIIKASTQDTFNICSGTPLHVRDIVRCIRDLSTSSSVLSFDPALDRVNLSTYACGDPSKLLGLGWTPTMMLVDGLRRLICEKTASAKVDLDGLHSEF